MPAMWAHSSVCLSLTSSEIRIIFHVLSQDTLEAASTLQGKLAGLIEVEDGTDGELDETEHNGELNENPTPASYDLDDISLCHPARGPFPCPRNGRTLHSQGQW